MNREIHRRRDWRGERERHGSATAVGGRGAGDQGFMFGPTWTLSENHTRGRENTENKRATVCKRYKKYKELYCDKIWLGSIVLGHSLFLRGCSANLYVL